MSNASNANQRASSYSKLNQAETGGQGGGTATTFTAQGGNFSKTKCLFVGLIVLLTAVFIGVGLGYGLTLIAERELMLVSNKYWHGDFAVGTFQRAAVTTHTPICAKIGADMLEKNGSAMDAAIAALLCEGVNSPQSMGLGGGFFMLAYTREDKKVKVIDARETAPAKATLDMFANDPNSSLAGPLSVAVPGEMRGYALAHQMYGKLNWSELFEPTIKLCKDGVPVSARTAYVLKMREQYVLRDPHMREIFYNNQTENLLREKEVMKRPQLAKTLEILAEKGAEELYTGELARLLVDDLQRAGGIITTEDLRDYHPRILESVRLQLEDLEMHGMPPPGSGHIFAILLQILERAWNDSRFGEGYDVLKHHRLIEACKYAFTYRTSLADGDFVDMSKFMGDVTNSKLADQIAGLIDDDGTFDSLHYTKELFYLKEDHGTGHVSVLASNGDAVTVTSTLNLGFGAVIRSPSTGIILNNEMDDFSTPDQSNFYSLPPNPSNYIHPGQRPASSMTPVIFLNKTGDVVYVYGAVGGTKIISAMADVFGRHHWLGKNIEEAVAASRVHHQLIPNRVEYEDDLPKDLLHGLEDLGHNTTRMGIRPAVMIIARDQKDGTILAISDRRRKGGTAGF